MLTSHLSARTTSTRQPTTTKDARNEPPSLLSPSTMSQLPPLPLARDIFRDESTAACMASAPMQDEVLKGMKIRGCTLETRYETRTVSTTASARLPTNIVFDDRTGDSSGWSVLSTLGQRPGSPSRASSAPPVRSSRLPLLRGTPTWYNSRPSIEWNSTRCVRRLSELGLSPRVLNT